MARSRFEGHGRGGLVASVVHVELGVEAIMGLFGSAGVRRGGYGRGEAGDLEWIMSEDRHGMYLRFLECPEGQVGW